MACKVADRSERGSTGILVAFWTFFISVTGLNFPYEQKTKFVPPTGPARLPGSYEDALKGNFYLLWVKPVPLNTSQLSEDPRNRRLTSEKLRKYHSICQVPYDKKKKITSRLNRQKNHRKKELSCFTLALEFFLMNIQIKKLKKYWKRKKTKH